MRNALVIVAVALISISANAREWSPIQGARTLESKALCLMIQECREKYEANEKCKADFYKERQSGSPIPRKKRDPIPEYEEFKNKMSEMRILKDEK